MKSRVLLSTMNKTFSFSRCFIDLDEDPQVESGGAMLAIVVLHQ